MPGGVGTAPIVNKLKLCMRAAAMRQRGSPENISNRQHGHEIVYKWHWFILVPSGKVACSKRIVCYGLRSLRFVKKFRLLNAIYGF
jgi:hypothetical protein